MLYIVWYRNSEPKVEAKVNAPELIERADISPRFASPMDSHDPPYVDAETCSSR